MTRSKKAKMATEVDSPAVSAIHKPKSISPNTLTFSNSINKNEQPKTEQNASQSNAVATMEFALGEVVWAKIRGWCHWPAVIKSIVGNKYNVLWLNDYRTTVVFRTQLFKFHSNFDQFSKKFPNVVGLETAAKEAVIYSVNKKK